MEDPAHAMMLFVLVVDVVFDLGMVCHVGTLFPFQLASFKIWVRISGIGVCVCVCVRARALSLPPFLKSFCCLANRKQHFSGAEAATLCGHHFGGTRAVNYRFHSSYPWLQNGCDSAGTRVHVDGMQMRTCIDVHMYIYI
jgi:hypothetical protein